jgi:hypothetical protein
MHWPNCSTFRGMISRGRYWRCGLGFLIVLVAGLLYVAYGALESVEPIIPNLPLPNAVLYAAHANVATALNRFGGPPVAAVVQWGKAASHARSPAEVTRAAEGIARAKQRGNDDEQITRDACRQFVHGSPETRDAIAQAGIRCAS